jgi:hypothetical protein
MQKNRINPSLVARTCANRRAGWLLGVDENGLTMQAGHICDEPAPAERWREVTA